MGSLNRFNRDGELYGMLAFAGTGIGAFSTYVFATRLSGEPWQVAVTFVLGGAFIVAGVLSSRLHDEDRPASCWRYCLVQAALGLGAVYCSPAKGFFAILLLPLASQAIFIFSWPVSLAWGVTLYLVSSLLYFPRWGWPGFAEALISYSPAYLFTMVFSYVTRQALRARECALALSTELENANAKLRAQAEQAEELATTRERNRLAREIHDGVGHYLTVINVQLEAARSVWERDPNRAVLALDRAVRLSRDALDDVRRSVGSLRADEHRLPLRDTLQTLVADAGLPVALNVVGVPCPLRPAVEHALFRAAQEGLTNVRKHAAASQADLRIDFSDPQRVRLTIRDDGRGARESSGEGYGLRGMRERIDLLGGTVRAGSGEGGGFELLVEIPA